MGIFLLPPLFILAQCGLATNSTCMTDRNWDNRQRVNCPGMGLTDIPAGLNLTTEVLNFTDNSFALLSWISYKDFVRLHELDLSRNEVSTLVESSALVLPTLRILRLSGNRLQELHQDAFATATGLMEIYLRGNQLRYLSAESFRGLYALEILDLSQNLITALPQNLLALLPSSALKTFNLQDNQLTVLPNFFFDTKPGIPYVYLSKNPWVCSCEVDYLSKWLEQEEHNVYIHADPSTVTNDPESVVCDSPGHLKLKPIIELTEAQFCAQPDEESTTSATPSHIFTTMASSSFSMHTTTPQPIISTPLTSLVSPVKFVTEIVTLWYSWFYDDKFVDLSVVSVTFAARILDKVNTRTEKAIRGASSASRWTGTTPLEINTYAKSAESTIPLSTAQTSTVLPATHILTDTTSIATRSASSIFSPRPKTTPGTVPPATTVGLPRPKITPGTVPPAATITLAWSAPAGRPTFAGSMDFVRFELQMLNSEAERPVVFYCFWLLVCNLCLCVLLCVWLCAASLWLLRTYLQVYLPLSRQQTAAAKRISAQGGGATGGCAAAYGAAAVSLPMEGAGGVQAVFRSVLFVSVSDEGEGGAEGGALTSSEVGVDGTASSAQIPDRGSMCLKRQTAAERLEEQDEVFRKTLYRMVSREGEAPRLENVLESCELSNGGAGVKQCSKELNTRYSLILREERSGTEGGAEGGANKDWSGRGATENEWLVGEWEWKPGDREQRPEPWSLMHLAARCGDPLLKAAEECTEANLGSRETFL